MTTEAFSRKNSAHSDLPMFDGCPIITIDGPTASGKGTIARMVASKLGFHYLDSGALYRLTALASLHSVDMKHLAEGTPEYVAALVKLIGTLNIVFAQEQITLNGQDVSQAIRAEEVGQRASAIAVYAPVRAALLAWQQAFCQLPGLVADGRDMGTVVFPEAPLKIFLTASVEARAKRRYEQLQAQGQGFSASIGTLLKNLEERDARDSKRAVAPLKPAPDAKILDTSSMCVDEVVTTVMEWSCRLG